MWVKFTKKVDDLFGGVYQNERYIAREGSVLEVPDEEFSRLNRDFPSLVKKATAADVKKIQEPPAPPEPDELATKDEPEGDDD